MAPRASRGCRFDHAARAVDVDAPGVVQGRAAPGAVEDDLAAGRRRVQGDVRDGFGVGAGADFGAGTAAAARATAALASTMPLPQPLHAAGKLRALALSIVPT